jgi:hypothetical protein
MKTVPGSQVNRSTRTTHQHSRLATTTTDTSRVLVTHDFSGREKVRGNKVDDRADGAVITKSHDALIAVGLYSNV